MNITDVRIRKIVADGKLKAVASITLDNEFVVHDIKIIEGQNGLFIAMPSKKVSETEFRDIAHPIVSEARNKIRDVIFAEYELFNYSSLDCPFAGSLLFWSIPLPRRGYDKNTGGTR